MKDLELNFESGDFYSEPLDVEFEDKRVSFVIPMHGKSVIKSTSDARRLAKALNLWAEWQDLKEGNQCQ